MTGKPPSSLVRTFENYLSPQECAKLIRDAGPELRPAKVGIALAKRKRDETARNNTTCFLYPDRNDTVRRIYARISETIGVPTSHFEAMQIGHYEPGQFYKVHSDDRIEKPENPRSHTFLMYLNEPEAGGATTFHRLNKTVTPETGKAVLFRPTRRRGWGYESLEDLEHEAHPVEAGEKWIATCWVHYYPYGVARSGTFLWSWIVLSIAFALTFAYWFYKKIDDIV